MLKLKSFELQEKMPIGLSDSLHSLHCMDIMTEREAPNVDRQILAHLLKKNCDDMN